MARDTSDAALASQILEGRGAEAALYEGEYEEEEEEGALERILKAPFRGIARVASAVSGAPGAAREFVFETYGLGSNQSAEARAAGFVRLLLVIALGLLFLYVAYRGTRALFGLGSSIVTQTTGTGLRIAEKTASVGNLLGK